METSWYLVPLGFGVGMFGTLVGAGGGFILMPIFFLLYPQVAADQLTALSLAVVFFNALSGTVAYARAGRVDYRSGLQFAAASFPGAIAGAIVTGYLSRDVFDPLFAALLILAGAYLFARPARERGTEASGASSYPVRVLTDRSGVTHHLSYSLPLGLSISVAVGFLSSVLGIGGGIIHVPALVRLLRFPVHIATATSHFILAAMTLVATLVHWYRGDLAWAVDKIGYLAAGVILGAQAGARLSTRVHGYVIIRALALALVFVGIRILISR